MRKFWIIYDTKMSTTHAFSSEKSRDNYLKKIEKKKTYFPNRYVTFTTPFLEPETYANHAS